MTRLGVWVVAAVVLAGASTQAAQPVDSTRARGETGREAGAERSVEREPAGAPAWSDARTALIVERYLDILKARPVEGEVFRNLASIYDVAGRLDELAARLGALSARNPGDAWPLLLEGHLERYRGNPVEADRFYAGALRLEPDSYLARRSVARTLEELSRRAEAESAYVSALQVVARAGRFGLDPTDETVGILRALGRIALSAGRTDDARTYWQKLVELDPANLLRREELAGILLENRLFDDAVRTYETIVQRSADEPVRRAKAYQDIAGVYEQAGRLDEAAAAVRKALELTESGNWLRQQVLTRLFELAERSGRLKELDAEFTGRAEANPRDAETWRQLIRVRERLGDGEGVARAYRSLVPLRPDDLDVRREYVRHLLSRGAWKEAADELREVVRHDPKEARDRFELARALRLAGAEEEARKVLEGVAADFARNPQAQLELAGVFEERGLDDLARAAYQRAAAAAQDPGTTSDPGAAATFRRALGDFEMRRGRPEEAVKVWQGIVQTRPKSADAHSALAKILHDAHMPEKALESCRAAAELAPSDPVRWRELAETLLETGRFDEAVRAWGKVAELHPAGRAGEKDDAWEQIISIYQSRERLPELLREFRGRHAKTPDDEPSVERLGRILERMGDLDGPEGAVALYEDFLARHPARPPRAPSDASGDPGGRMMLSLARLYPDRGQPEKSVELYEKLIGLDPARAGRYLSELISEYLDLDRGEDALGAARRLVELHPLDPATHAELARVYETLGLFTEAAATLRKALDLRPDDHALLDALAKAYEASGDVEPLKEVHRRVLRTTRNADAFRESVRKLINLTYGTAEFAGLERLLLLRVSQDRREFAGYRALAEFYRAAETPEKVPALYREALEAVPVSSRGEVLEALSRHFEEVGDVGEAVRYAEELRTLEGGLSRDMLLRLSPLYFLSGRVDEARKTLETWWRTDDKNPDVHRELAEISLRYGDVEGAVDALKRMLELPPRHPGEEGDVEQHVIRLQVGGLYERMNRPDDAAKMYFEILRRVPGVREEKGARGPGDKAPDPVVFGTEITVGPLTPAPAPTPSLTTTYSHLRVQAIEGLVRVYTERNRLEDLVKGLEGAVAREPRRQQRYDDLARALQLAGETDRMVQVLERARDRFPNVFDWRRDLARAYRQVGRFKDALREYQAAVQEMPELEPELRGELVETCLKLKAPDEVERIVRRLIQSGEDLLRIKEVTDKCSEMRFHESAAKLLDEALRVAPVREVSSRLDVAEYLRRAGKTKEVYAEVKTFLEGSRGASRASLSPGAILEERTSVLNRLWRLLRPGGLAAKLLAELDEESLRKGDDPALLADLAVLQGRMGRIDAQLVTLERILDVRAGAKHESPARGEAQPPGLAPQVRPASGGQGSRASSQASVLFVKTILGVYRSSGKLTEAGEFVRRLLANPKYAHFRVPAALIALQDLPGLTPENPLAKELIRVILGGKQEGVGPEPAGPEAHPSPLKPQALSLVSVADFYWTHGHIAQAVECLRQAAGEDGGTTWDVALRLAWYLRVHAEQEGLRPAEVGLAAPKNDVTGGPSPSPLTPQASSLLKAESMKYARRAAELALRSTTGTASPSLVLYRERTVQLAETVRRFRDTGFIDVLRERFEEVLRGRPDEPMGYYDVAIVRELGGDGEGALEVLKQLAAKSPGDPQAKLALVEVLEKTGRQAEAIRELETVVRAVRPPQRELYERLADAYAANAQPLAELELKEHETVVFHEPALLADVARQYREINMNDRALAVFKRYLRLKYGPGVLYGQAEGPVAEYAQFLRQIGRAEEAIGLLDRALAAGRLRGRAGSVLAAGGAGVRTPGSGYGSPPASQTPFIAFADGDDGASGLRYELAACYQALGRLPELIASEERRLDGFPTDTRGPTYGEVDFLAGLYAAEGRKDRVIDLRRKLARVRATDVNNLTQLAQTLREERRLDEAIAVTKRLLELDAQNAGSCLAPIAEMYYEQGNVGRAVETVEMHRLDRFGGSRPLAERLQAMVYLYGTLGLHDREDAVSREIIAETPDQSLHAYVALIRRELERGRLDEACGLAVRTLEETPNDSGWGRNQVVDAVLSNKTKRPETLLTIAESLGRSDVVRNDPELSARIDVTMHQRLMELRRPDLAVGCLVRAWRAGHSDRQLVLDAARELSELARTEEADALLAEALLYFPDDVELTLETAREALASNRPARGEPILAEIVRRSPTEETRLEVGRMLAETPGTARRALTYLDEVRRLRPDLLDVTTMEAGVLVRLGETDRAVKLWEDVLTRFPTEKVALEAGRFFLSVDRTGPAEGAFRSVLRLNPNAVEATQLLGDALRKEGKHEECIRLYRAAIDLFEEKWTKADFGRRLQRTLREAGLVDAAVADSERALVEADAEWSRLSLELAKQLEARGRAEESAPIYRRLATLSRDATIREDARGRLAALEKKGAGGKPAPE